MGASPIPVSAELAPLQPDLDYHSFANIEQFRVQRMELDLWVDSAQKVLRGTVGLQIKRLDPGATQLILDTRGLQVSEVSEKPEDVLGAITKTETTWVSRAFHLERQDPILGQALVIELAPSKRATEFIRIHYETVPDSPALQWVAASQTPGRSKPFLYTLSAPLGTRGWIPVQDTPQVRVAYKATVHTNSDVLAVMTGKNESDSLRRPAKRNGVYSFVMADAIPSYAISLAVGDLSFQDTGPRTGVYALAPQLKLAVKAFADNEALLSSAEKLLGPYRWERFDIVVMPASFPVASVGDPPLALLSPSVITLDKSSTFNRADALAHGWAGNSVANATWRDRWLTEGFSAYLAGRWVSDAEGEPLASMQSAAAVGSLRAELTSIATADQALALDLRDRDPNAASLEFGAEKGRLFLEFLEMRFGRERFDAFLRDYFLHFAMKSVSTAQFRVFLQDNLLDRYPGIATRDEVAEWLMSPGVPQVSLLTTTGVFASVDAIRDAWVTGRLPAKHIAAQGWVQEQWVYFLDTLPEAVTPAQLGELDRVWKFSRGLDAQVASRWFHLVIYHHYQPAYVSLEAYLTTQGRTALILPLYEELMRTAAGATQARRVYASARPNYQAQTAAAVDAVVRPLVEAEDE